MNASFLAKLTASMVTLVALASLATAQNGWTTRGFTYTRTAANQSENKLNLSNVNTGTFGKLFARQVDGQIYGQPLVVPKVTVNGGTFNVVYVTTQHDSVYAFDADNAANSQPLWHVNFLNAANNVTTIPYYNLSTQSNITPEIGITSTPAIDTVGQTIYVVARTLEGDPNIDASYHQRLHALDLRTGAEKFGGPVELAASVPGIGAGSVNNTITYNCRTQNQRPALVLWQGRLYISSASHGEVGPFHGWILGYDAATLKLTSSFCATPNSHAGGFWSSGGAFPIGSGGDLYATTGNGPYVPATGSWGDSILRLDAKTLKVKDSFTPYDQLDLANWDYDLGINSAILIPGTSYLVNGSKTGKVYVVDGSKMGGFNAAGDNQIVQWWWACTGLTFGEPTFWQGGANGNYMYIWSSADALKMYKWTGTNFITTPVATSTYKVPSSPGGMLAVSSSGSNANTAIVWATTPVSGNAYKSTVPGMLRAYNAMTLKEIWNSQMTAFDDYGNLAKFNPPIVINSKVYVPTFSNQLVVYGLLPKVTPPAVGLTAEPGNNQVALTWPTVPGAASESYTIYRGAPNGPFAVIGTASNTLSYIDTTAVDGTTYGYYVVSKNAYGTGPKSNVAIVTPVAYTTAKGTGLEAQYYADPDVNHHFTTPVLTEIDSKVNFNWGTAAPVAGVDPAHFSATWRGSLIAPTTGFYSFQLMAQDGTRLWVKGQKVIDDWNTGLTTSNSAPILLLANKPYPIQLEYYGNTGSNKVSLDWLAPGTAGYTTLPQSALVPYGAGGSAIEGPVDLTSQFNLDAISTLANPSDGDIGYLGQTMAAELLPTTLTTGTNPGMQFLLGPQYDGAMNMIVCDGRTIPVPVRLGAKVSLLGCAVGGEAGGYFILNYADGLTSILPVSFTDWDSPFARHGESVAVRMLSRHNTMGLVPAVTTLFQYDLPVDPTRTLVSISLPLEDDMRLLAISVRK